MLDAVKPEESSARHNAYLNSLVPSVKEVEVYGPGTQAARELLREIGALPFNPDYRDELTAATEVLIASLKKVTDVNSGLPPDAEVFTITEIYLERKGVRELCGHRVEPELRDLFTKLADFGYAEQTRDNRFRLHYPARILHS